MRILAIESSCDDTGASVLKNTKNKIIVLSNVLSSSIKLHKETGGIIPEQAAREQVKVIIPVIEKALLESENLAFSKDNKKNFQEANKILQTKIDAIAVTYGPGLIGSLLVGVETAKTFSFALNKPLIPVNHLLAHIYANFIDHKIVFPFVGLIISGGHTDLIYFKNDDNFKWLGGTRDDASGEAFDKIGRLLGLSYPAGPEIERRASKAKKRNLNFTSPLIDSKDYDFSFSGLKTEVSRLISKMELDEKIKNEICYGVQKAVTDVLVKKTIKAAINFRTSTILLGGGVSANNYLRNTLNEEAKKQLENPKIVYPKLEYCTDNATMVGAYALRNFNPVDWENLHPNPELYFQ